MNTIQIGLLGLGTVGTGVYKLLSRIPSVNVKQIAVRDTAKTRDLPGVTPEQLTTDVDAVIADPDIDVIVEVMGGNEFPCAVIEKSLSQGKHVVTANKVVIANHGPKLFELADTHGVNLLFEAAVAGGIPIVLPLKTSLIGNDVQQIAGILNGTTNYMLSRMEVAGLDFQQALKEAQDLGFAEADPTADVEGHDAACKIGILASIAAQKRVDQAQIYAEGITNITPMDISMAQELNYTIRLVGLAKFMADQSIDIRVHPVLVPNDHPLSKIMYENNAIWVQGDAVGDTMFYGKGAGELPTASAVVGDIMLIADALQQGQAGLKGLQFHTTDQATLMPIGDTRNAYYIRLETQDEPGVVGALGTICGEHQVSLNAVLQKQVETDAQGTATIVLLTHHVLERDVQAALAHIRELPSTIQVHTVLRVFAS